MTTPTTLTKKQKNPAWHGEAVATIRENFTSITAALFDATRRSVWLGLLLNHIKARGKEDGSIPHGQFGPWLEKNLPDLPRATVTFYLTLGRGIMEKAELPFSKCLKLAFSHPGELPKEVEPLIQGKTQNQLFLEYKQAKVKDDCFIPAVGRLKGHGGATKLQRELAQQSTAAAAIEAQELRAAEVSEWLLQISDDAHAGHWSESVLDQLYEACESATGYMGRLRGARRIATRRSAAVSSSTSRSANNNEVNP